MWFIKWLLFGLPVACAATFVTLHVSELMIEDKHALTPSRIFLNYVVLQEDYLNAANERFKIQPEKVDLDYHKEQFWGQDVTLQPNEIDIAYHDLAVGFAQDQRNLQFLPLMISYWIMLAMGGILFHGFTISKKLPA